MTQQQLITFHNTIVTKPEIMRQLRAHAKADAIIKGQYWEDGKGCAVGCTIHSGNHAEYEPRFGIPQALARLEDTIFEGLPNDRAMKWPIRFMSAVEPGRDLSRVQWRFLHWLLTDEKVNPGINHPLVRDAVKKCADILVPLTKGNPVDRSAASSASSAAHAAESAAWSAADAAWSAARGAASSAESAAHAAESAAWSAARGAAWSAAESAAWSAASSAESAASSAESAASSAESAASAAYVKMSDKLIALIKAAPKATRRKAA